MQSINVSILLLVTLAKSVQYGIQTAVFLAVIGQFGNSTYQFQMGFNLWIAIPTKIQIF